MNKDQAIDEKELNEREQKSAEDSKLVEETQAALPSEPADKLVELEEKLALEKDKCLRLLAEFENYKKRTLKERIELLKYAGTEVIISFLPVLDDFERARQAYPLSDGVMLVYNKLIAIFEKNGLKPMDSIGKDFDPELHDALSNVEVQDPAMKNKVVDEIEKGYYLNDKVIRHAKVVVGN
ncbi:MAG: nucleotide exchange factor GrpE [Bacteroidia bacterium]